MENIDLISDYDNFWKSNIKLICTELDNKCNLISNRNTDTQYVLTNWESNKQKKKILNERLSQALQDADDIIKNRKRLKKAVKSDQSEDECYFGEKIEQKSLNDSFDNKGEELENFESFLNKRKKSSEESPKTFI